MARETYRLHGDPRVPPTGAMVVGHLYPTVGFAWIIRTGAEVDRTALATEVANLTAREINQHAATQLRTVPELAATDWAFLDSIICRRLRRAAVQALKTRYALHSDIPKGATRVRVEALILRFMLELAAQRRRERTV